MRAEMRNAEKDLKYLMRFARGDIEAIARHWINRALELETENLHLQKEADRLLERERHAVHHSETYKRLVDRTREVDKVRKEVERLREALKHACIAVEIYSGSCPYDKHDSCQFPGRCTDQYSECWQEYFISKVKPPGERTDSK
jgi:predicted ATPase